MFSPRVWISWICLLFPFFLSGVLSHLIVLRTVLPSAEPAMESPGEPKVFEGRQILGEDGGFGEGRRRVRVGRGGKH